jgi:glycine cleavage system H protein
LLSVSFSPLLGKVVAVNAALADKPETINEDAWGEGWIFVVQPDDMEQFHELLTPDDYAAMVDEEGH